VSAMWKPSQSGSTSSTPSPPHFQPQLQPGTVRPVPSTPAFEPARQRRQPVTRPPSARDCSSRGDLRHRVAVIDGKVEGSINLPGNRVTVGRNGQVAASITAREIVILGKIRGNVVASDRVDIRAEGALTGDVAAARISIEDGAYFKGGIDIRKADAKPVSPISSVPMRPSPSVVVLESVPAWPTHSG